MLNFTKIEYRLPDSPWRRVGESSTPRLAESGSHRLSDSPRFSFKHSKVDSPTRRVGESFFDYEYRREFEAKSGTALKAVYGIYEDPISAKTPENPPHCHVPLSRRGLVNGRTNFM